MRPNEDLIEEIARALERCSDAATRGESSATVAREWAAAGFDSAEDVEDWLGARCFSAAGAKALDDAGLTPEQAAIRTREGATDYEDTIGFKVSNGDLSTDAARRIATNSFWNT
ncbi:MAG TPA: hypothetical protein VF240_08375 [Pyrinomonadaceae bacterium]